MVLAQSQFETAQRHLQTLNQVGQREQIRGAQAQMDAAKAHLDNATVQLSYAEIRTPIAGVVSDRPVYPGEMPPSGTPILSIVDLSQIVPRTNIPLKNTPAIKLPPPP